MNETVEMVLRLVLAAVLGGLIGAPNCRDLIR